jgi:hypothetical protein
MIYVETCFWRENIDYNSIIRVAFEVEKWADFNWKCWIYMTRFPLMELCTRSSFCRCELWINLSAEMFCGAYVKNARKCGALVVSFSAATKFMLTLTFWPNTILLVPCPSILLRCKQVWLLSACKHKLVLPGKRCNDFIITEYNWQNTPCGLRNTVLS